MFIIYSVTISAEEIVTCQSPAWEFPQQSKSLQAYVTGFRVLGKRPSERLSIADFDIIITRKEERLVPLFRLLRLLEATGKLENDKLFFRLESSPEVVVDLKQHAIIANSCQTPVFIEIGNSDVTNSGEIYISESILREGFGFDFAWSEQDYEYVIKTEKSLAAFKSHKRQTTSLLLTRVEQELINLSETEPPSYPQNSQQLITFIKPEFRGETVLRKTETQRLTETYLRPSLILWGNIGGGFYRLRLSQNLRTPHMAVPSFPRWIDEGVWTAKHEDLMVRAGDGAIGFSELVMPGGNIFGATVKWFPAKKGRESMRDLFFASRGSRFLSEGTFEGVAQLGATIELWVNNRLIQTKVVEIVVPEKPGYGYYFFESVGLLDRSLNNIRIIIKQLDGVVEEHYRQVLGTTALLPKRQMAVLSAAGAKRLRTLESTDIYGFLSGGQILYGLTDRLTIGFTGATQNGYANLKNTTQEIERAPRSYHESQQAYFKVFENVLCRGEYALNYDVRTEQYDKAYKAGADVYWKSLMLDGEMFFYGPHYMNGMTTIMDRKGFVANGTARLFKTTTISGVGVHVEDNVSKGRADTRKEDVVGAGFSNSGIIPRSTVSTKAYYSRWHDLSLYSAPVIARTYVAELASMINKKLSFEARNVFGDDAALSTVDRLTYGISLSGIDQLYTTGWQVKMNYRFSERNTIVANYWQDSSFNQVQLSHYHKYYNEAGRHLWSSRLEAGEVLSEKEYYSRAYLELNLDEPGSNRLGFKAGSEHNGKEYYGGLYLTVGNLLYLRDKNVRKVRQYGISPELGGIDGIVYLDLNGNGHREPGEPGVGNVDIMVDGRSKTASDKYGNFFISRLAKKDNVSVSLDVSSLPAIYTPTQGKQTVYWKEGVFTKACLGVCVSNAISGTVKTGSYSGTMHGISGVRILLMSEDQKTVIKDSITADDGSYYIGEVKPGNYVVDVDFSSIPSVRKPIEPPRKITVVSSTEPYEIEHCDFNLIVQK